MQHSILGRSNPDPNLIPNLLILCFLQAVSSLIYAAARVTDLQELGAIKSLLAAKFGKEYAAEAASDHLCRKWHVNDNLIRRAAD